MSISISNIIKKFLVEDADKISMKINSCKKLRFFEKKLFRFYVFEVFD